MDRLYTPWRHEYVSSLHDEQSCVLCSLKEKDDEEVGTLLQASHWYVILNKYPYTSGHLLVVSRRHVGSLAGLSAEEMQEGSSLLQRCEHALREVYHPQGLNVGLNLGRAAGAGVEGHFHWHMLPRWSGDANFISVVGGTRVLPESLEQSYRKLLPYFAEES